MPALNISVIFVTETATPIISPSMCATPRPAKSLTIQRENQIRQGVAAAALKAKLNPNDSCLTDAEYDLAELLSAYDHAVMQVKQLTRDLEAARRGEDDAVVIEDEGVQQSLVVSEVSPTNLNAAQAVVDAAHERLLITGQLDREHAGPEYYGGDTDYGAGYDYSIWTAHEGCDFSNKPHTTEYEDSLPILVKIEGLGLFTAEAVN